MVTLDLDGRIRCLDNQICPDIVYRPGDEIEKVISIYKRIGNVRDSVERNVADEYRKDELTDRLDTIYFKWIGELNRMGDGIDDEILRLIEMDVDNEKLERTFMNPSGRDQYLDVTYGNSFGTETPGTNEEYPLFSDAPTPLPIISNYNSGKKDHDFPEYSGEVRRNYLELSSSSRQIARGVEFLEKHGYLNPKRSLERLEELENKISLESDEWIKDELTENIDLLRNSFLSYLQC